MSRLPNKYWTNDRLNKLRTLMARGMTNEEIAKHLRLKKRQVETAISYHGLTNHTIGPVSYTHLRARRKVLLKLQPPEQFMRPSPIPEVVTQTEEPAFRGLQFMQAVEENTCLWMDGKLECCGAPRKKRSRYCQHHHEKSLKSNEVKL